MYILWLEMFAWTTVGPRTFRSIPAELFAPTRVLAANQGLYNGFLAAGLLWGLSLGTDGLHIKLFFLACVLLAGIFGAITVSRRILYIQGLPALLAVLLLLLR